MSAGRKRKNIALIDLFIQFFFSNLSFMMVILTGLQEISKYLSLREIEIAIICWSAVSEIQNKNK
jgi:hypothetical protein